MDDITPFKLWSWSKNTNLNLYSIFMFRTYQDFKLLICYFYLNMSSELFHNKVVKQSISLESQASFGWGIRWRRFNSNGDIDLCPEERSEARLNSITYYKIVFKQLFSLSISAGMVQSYPIFFPLQLPLTGCRSNLCCFFSFPFRQKTPSAFTLCKAILTSLASLSCSWKQGKVMSRLACTESASQDRLI